MAAMVVLVAAVAGQVRLAQAEPLHLLVKVMLAVLLLCHKPMAVAAVALVRLVEVIQ
jgi:hypothetical protein